MAALWPQLRAWRSSRNCGVSACNPADLGGGRIVAAVIDIDDLVDQQAVERCTNLGDQRRDIAGLVLDRDDDRKIHQLDPGQRVTFATDGSTAPEDYRSPRSPNPRSEPDRGQAHGSHRSRALARPT